MHLSHGPRTFEGAGDHVSFTHEEAPKLTPASQAMLQDVAHSRALFIFNSVVPIARSVCTELTV